MKAVRLLTVCSIGLTAATACAQNASPLGRLFLTPAERYQLERMRQLNIQETRSIEGGSLRLDGVVLRSSGKSTVWVNRRPQEEDASDTGLTAKLSRRQPDRATLATGGEAPAELKVGQTLDRASRETSGGLSGGEIRVHRSSPQR